MTPLACLLLNSTWEFWKLSIKNCLQGDIIQPNSLWSIIYDLKWSTTLSESRAKSTLSKWNAAIHCNTMWKPKAYPTLTSQRGEKQICLRKNKRTWIISKTYSNTYLPRAGFVHSTTSMLLVPSCGIEIPVVFYSSFFFPFMKIDFMILSKVVQWT